MRIIRASVRQDMREFKKKKKRCGGASAPTRLPFASGENRSRGRRPRLMLIGCELKSFATPSGMHAVPFAKLGSLERARESVLCSTAVVEKRPSSGVADVSLSDTSGRAAAILFFHRYFLSYFSFFFLLVRLSMGIPTNVNGEFILVYSIVKCTRLFAFATL